jgi:hypothetical protein
MKASKREKMKVAKIFDGKGSQHPRGQDDWSLKRDFPG